MISLYLFINEKEREKETGTEDVLCSAFAVEYERVCWHAEKPLFYNDAHFRG